MWDQKMMGVIDWPYHLFQVVTWAKIITMVYQLDSNNPLAWYKVVLKFPGTE